MKLSSFSALLTPLMTDRVYIYRYVNETENNITKTTLSNEPVVSAPCRISFDTRDKPSGSSIDETKIEFRPKLFVGTDVDIRAGDKVVITRYNDDNTVMSVYTGQAGEPACYPSHKEVLVYIEGSA